MGEEDYEDTYDLSECCTCAECVHFCRRGVYEDGYLTGISYFCQYDAPFIPEPDDDATACQHFNAC